MTRQQTKCEQRQII